MASSLAAISKVRRLRRLRAELGPRSRTPTRFTSSGLLGFIPRLSPHYAEPLHLAPLTEQLERLHHGRLRLCFSVPPRHGKSETVLHAIAYLLAQDPTTKILYVSHTASFARRQSKSARRLAKAAGVQLSADSNRADEWETVQGGGLVARGVDGEITGRGFDVILVDDPTKSRKVAESALARESMFEWFTSDVFTRLTPQGSVLVVHTRWHVDDLIGRLVKEKDFLRLNLPAVNDNGEALWPAGGWTIDVLLARQQAVGEYAWWSLYQGEPRPRGGNVFEEPTFFDELPTRGYRVGRGIDLAYTAKGQGRRDWSVFLELWRCGEYYYVVEVIRKQVDATSFALTLKAKATERPGVRMRWSAAGTEKGAASFFRKAKIPIHTVTPHGDPFVRAQDVAAAWNAGKVLVPNPEVFDETDTDWLHAFLDELGSFTGLIDKHDDQVVALADAFASVQTKTDAYGRLRGRLA